MLRGEEDCEFVKFLRQHESARAVQRFGCHLHSFAADEVEYEFVFSR